jgi:hypothetical protein
MRFGRPSGHPLLCLLRHGFDAVRASRPTALPGAVELCTGIQQDLALLAGQPPPSRPAAFVTGLITLPTFGLGYRYQ